MKLEFAIETQGLRKTFGRNVAVDGLTLEVHRGEIFGFLGPNGAGKSTSLKMLVGLVRPSAGQAMVLGLPAGEIAARARIGFLPEHFRFHDFLTADEFMAFHGSLGGLRAAQARQRSQVLLERLGLAGHRDRRLREFSKGMLQRIGIAQALLNDPELILLDEPTSGLDPGGRRLVRDLVLEQRRLGRTVFVNSHVLSEIEVTCDRVAFVKQGRVLQTLDLNRALRGERMVTAIVRGPAKEVLDGLDRWASSVRLDGDRLSMSVRGEDALPEVARFLVSQGLQLYSFSSKETSLEDLFLEIVGPEGGL